MPSAARTLALVIAVAFVPAVVAGCGGHRAASGFCATVGHGHSEFDSTNPDHSAIALAEFQRVAASAPAKLAPDLKTVHTVLELFYTNPKAIAENLTLFKRYVTATNRIDAYLKRTCGVSIPNPVKA